LCHDNGSLIKLSSGICFAPLNKALVRYTQGSSINKIVANMMKKVLTCVAFLIVILNTQSVRLGTPIVMNGIHFTIKGERNNIAHLVIDQKTRVGEPLGSLFGRVNTPLP